MKTHRHYTVAADNRLRRARGGCAAVWNDSNTIELTMTVQEIRALEKRLFSESDNYEIEDVVSDERMRILLDHFHGEGMLVGEEGVRI
jgi:hypothetical protein